ncbi:hypothetical protein FGIG_07014, partial [Fasciola gigantica]
THQDAPHASVKLLTTDGDRNSSSTFVSRSLPDQTTVPFSTMASTHYPSSRRVPTEIRITKKNNVLTESARTTETTGSSREKISTSRTLEFPRVRNSKLLTHGDPARQQSSDGAAAINSDGSRNLLKAIQIRSKQFLYDITPRPRGGSLDRIDTSRSKFSICSEEEEEDGAGEPPTPQAVTSCATESRLFTPRQNHHGNQKCPDVLKMRCDLLQTHLALLDARKQSMESSICRLDEEFKQKQQKLFVEQSPRLPIITEDASGTNEAVLKRQNEQLRILRETAFQCKLNCETSEAARFMLEEKLALACSEMEADKDFYQKQVEQLEQELKHSAESASGLRKQNLSLQSANLQLTNHVRQLEQEQTELRTEIDVLIAKCRDHLEVRIVELEQEKRQLNEHLVTIDKQTVAASEDHKHKMNELQRQIKEQQTQLDHLLSTKDQLTKQLQQAQALLVAKQQEEEDNRLALETKLRNSHLETELSLLQLRSEHLNNQQAIIGTIRGEYEREIEYLKCKHTEELGKLGEQLQENQRVVQQLNEELETHKQKSSNRDDHFTQTDALTLMRNTRTSDVDKLLEQICQLRMERDIAVKRAQDERVKSEQLQDEHEIAACRRSRSVVLVSGEKKSPEQTSESITRGRTHASHNISGSRKEKLRAGSHQGRVQNVLAIERERNMLLRFLTEVLMAVIETNNVESRKLTEILQIPSFQVIIPASLTLADNLDTSKIPPRTPLVSLLPNLREDIPRHWMTVLAESVGGWAACCSKMTSLVNRQQQLLDTQSHSLRELKAMATKQVDVLYEQLERMKKMQMNKTKQKMLHQDNTNLSRGDFQSEFKRTRSNMIPVSEMTKLRALERTLNSSNSSTPIIFGSSNPRSALSPSLELRASACPLIDYPVSQASTPRRSGSVSQMKVAEWPTQQIAQSRVSSRPTVGWTDVFIPTTHTNLSRNRLFQYVDTASRDTIPSVNIQ